MIEPKLHEELKRIAGSPVLLVACDFDGTLAAIAPTPGEACADDASIAALRRLSMMESTHVAVVTGRSRADVAGKLHGLTGVTIVGGHGAEMEGAPEPDLAMLDRLRAELHHVGEKYPGSLVEMKRSGVAVHYRHVEPSRHGAIRDEVRGIAEAMGCPLVRDGLLVVETGVVAADKGVAMRSLTQRFNAHAVLFVGDDVTDEDALSALRAGDVGVRVGSAESIAEYSVQDHAWVRLLLTELADSRETFLRQRRITPIDELALLSDQRTCALVDGGGRVVWMCTPRIDSAPVFASLLGDEGSGVFEVVPEDGRPVVRRAYEADTFMLRTEYDGLSVLDYLDCSGGRAYQRAGRSDLIRVVEGHGRVRIRFTPRIDFGRLPTRLRLHEHGLVVEGSADPISLRSVGVEWTIEEHGPHQSATASVALQGEPLVLEFRLGSTSMREAPVQESSRRAATSHFWTAWARPLRVPPLHSELVKRSALVIKSLCYGPTGAIAAAATTSLPEQLGGVRNWDYRFCWIRDACLSAAALVRLGSTGHAIKLLDWLNGIMEDVSNPERLRPIYTVKGAELGPEGEVPELRGYGESRPVRVGNGAGHQVQLDVFGVVADLIAMLAEVGAPLTPEHLHLLDSMLQAVSRRWHEPDHGIWEIRGPLRHHVHSKTLCWYAVSRACRAREIVGERVRPEDVELAGRIREDILARGVEERRGCFTAAYGDPQIDAACLLVGLLGLVPPEDPRFVATVHEVERELLDRGTVMRYRGDDGLPGVEGGFHLCTGWLIESLFLVGRRADAQELLDRYAAQAGPLGLYSEERDPVSGRALGNYPQAYSHLALINACCRLATF
ncbi:MAG: trehalose-phosphatase [Phycisphaeraceae bacterium]|nr:trehalose-phosphatase [Phycisphaeraceae bacterium]